MRLPLKPIMPAEDHEIALPWASVMVTMVLLKLALTCATPAEMFLRSRRLMRGVRVPFCSILLEILTKEVGRARPQGPPSGAYFFLPAIALALPLRVRALVCVRWPRTGSPLR